MPRPEDLGPPEIFYSEEEARKYTKNSRIRMIQRTMAERCIELLSLPNDPDQVILDIGCGSGISGSVLEEKGYLWVGMDISEAMLETCIESEEAENPCLLHADMGQGVPFAPGSFDGCISVSALQWLCKSNAKYEYPPKRLLTLFQSLYTSLRPGSRAVFQFYPDSDDGLQLIQNSAMKAGFTGGCVIDYPASAKAKKYYLTLFAGVSHTKLPKALGTDGSGRPNKENDDDDSEQESVSVAGRESRINHRRRRSSSDRPATKSREWILRKKDTQRLQGKDVRPDSKYTGRKRKNWKL